MENHDIEEIQRVLDDRYVKQKTCDERQKENNKRFANDDKRLVLIEDHWASLSKAGWIIATSVIGILVASILNLIMR